MEFLHNVYRMCDLLYLQRIINIIEEFPDELNTKRSIKTCAIYFEAMRVEKDYITSKYLRDDDKEKGTISIWNALAFYGEYYDEIDCFDDKFKDYLNEKVAELLKNLLIVFKDIIKVELKDFHPIFDSNSIKKFDYIVEFNEKEIDKFKEKHNPNDLKKLEIGAFNNLEEFFNLKAENFDDFWKKETIFERESKNKANDLFDCVEGSAEANPEKVIQKLIGNYEDLKETVTKNKKKIIIKATKILLNEVRRIIQVAIEYTNLKNYKKIFNDCKDMDKKLNDIWWIKTREMLKIFTPNTYLEDIEDESIDDSIGYIKHFRDICEHPYNVFYYKKNKGYDVKEEINKNFTEKKNSIDKQVKNRLLKLEQFLKKDFSPEYLWKILTIDKDLIEEINEKSFPGEKSKDFNDKKKYLISKFEFVKNIFDGKQLKNKFTDFYSKVENLEFDKREEANFPKKRKIKLELFNRRKKEKWVKFFSDLLKNERLKKDFEEAENKVKKKNLTETFKDLLEDIKANAITDKDIKSNFRAVTPLSKEDVLKKFKEVCEDLEQEISRKNDRHQFRKDLCKKIEFDEQKKCSDKDILNFQLKIDLNIIKGFSLLERFLDFKSEYPEKELQFSHLEKLCKELQPCRNFIVHEPWKNNFNKDDAVFMLARFCLKLICELNNEENPRKDEEIFNICSVYDFYDNDQQILHQLPQPQFLKYLGERVYEKGALLTMRSKYGGTLDLALKYENYGFARFLYGLDSDGLQRSKRLRELRFMFEKAATVKFLEDSLTERQMKIFDPIDFPIATTVFNSEVKNRELKEQIKIIEFLQGCDCFDIDSREIGTKNTIGHFLVCKKFDEDLEKFITSNKINMMQRNAEGLLPIHKITHDVGDWINFLLKDVHFELADKILLASQIIDSNNINHQILDRMKVKDLTLNFICVTERDIIRMQLDKKEYLVQFKNVIEGNSMNGLCFQKLFNVKINKLSEEKRMEAIFNNVNITFKFSNEKFNLDFQVDHPPPNLVGESSLLPLPDNGRNFLPSSELTMLSHSIMDPIMEGELNQGSILDMIIGTKFQKENYYSSGYSPKGAKIEFEGLKFTLCDNEVIFKENY